MVWLLGAADERVLKEGASFTVGAFADRARDLLSPAAAASDEAWAEARVRAGFLALGVVRVLSSRSVSVVALVGAAAAAGGLFFFVTLIVVDATWVTGSTAAGTCFLARNGRAIVSIGEERYGGLYRSIEFFFLSAMRSGGGASRACRGVCLLARRKRVSTIWR